MSQPVLAPHVRVKPFTLSKDGGRERKAGTLSGGPRRGGNTFSFPLETCLCVVLGSARLTFASHVFFQNGLNALHLAAKEGHIDLVQELLDRGAAVDSATKVRPSHFPTQGNMKGVRYTAHSESQWRLYC